MQLYYSRNEFKTNTFSIQLSNRLKSLLDNCPESMRSLSYAEKVKDNLSYIVAVYGYVLPFALSPREKTVSLSIFAEEIAKVYGLSNPRNLYFFDLLKELDSCLLESGVLP